MMRKMEIELILFLVRILHKLSEESNIIIEHKESSIHYSKTVLSKQRHFVDWNK